MNAPRTIPPAARRRWRNPRSAIVLAGAILAGTALAGAALAARGAEPPAWSATFATLDGDRFVPTAQMPGLALLNFWGVDCPPCVAELPRLQRYANAHTAWSVWLVATDPPPQARAFLARHEVSLPALRAGPDVAAVMRRAGNRQGTLPFTLALRNGAVCATHLGELSDEALAAMQTQCMPASP